MPSRPGPHIAKIKALGDNRWLILPDPAPDPKWGKEGIARGRAWGGRAFAYAQDLGGAFFAGEGVHGYVKSDGRRMDDLWFYDVNGNRWICLYPGMNLKARNFTLDEHGFEHDEKGDFNPCAYLGHAYGRITYHPGLKKLVLLYAYVPYWNQNRMPQRAEWLGIPSEHRKNIYATGKLNINAMHPLFWDVEKGGWERRFVEGFDRKTRSEDGVVEYIPSLDKVLFARYNTVWLYDYEKNAWTRIKTAGAKMPGYENGCYDPKRERLYIARQNVFAYYDLKNRRWTKIHAEGQPGRFDHSGRCCMRYDTANDVVVFHFKIDKKRLHGDIAVYDPKTNTWTRPPCTFPIEALRARNPYQHYLLHHGFYVPDLNVHFYYLAGDSSNNKTAMVVYRYKRRKKGE